MSEITIEVENTDLISDGYHTFGELYEHRITLYIALCKLITEIPNHSTVWRSILHSDGTTFDGWFLLGVCVTKGEQITYHLPLSRWTDCYFAEILDIAPEFDGHTPKDVLERIANL